MHKIVMMVIIIMTISGMEIMNTKYHIKTNYLISSSSYLLVTASNFSSKYGINWDSTLLAKSLSPPHASARLK